MPDFTDKDEPENTEIKESLSEMEDILSTIEKHLDSIRGMLKFFVVLIILGIILQSCTILMR